MAREINLVPDIKNEMIRTLKLRNLIFFICIIVASASVGITFIFGVIVGGQQIAIDNKTNTLKTFSEKINSYSDLNDFLTIKDQVGNIGLITNDKKVASRTFNILSALIPRNGDVIQFSELSIDLSSEAPTFTFEAQANATRAPFIDYNVLDSFKKSMQYMRYDYGNYVDKNGDKIPAYCMIERDADGAFLSDPERGMYAYWTILAEGCNNLEQKDISNIDFDESGNMILAEGETKIADYDVITYGDTPVVQVWRTPQFDDWYNESYLKQDGTISGIEHFESACIKYFSEQIGNSNRLKWTESNDTCLLVPGGNDGISIHESSNGRDSSESLVLRFTATITLAPEVYNFNNFHMIAFGPSERVNVTDSYVQIQAMFAERAKDCQEGDTACSGNGGN